MWSGRALCRHDGHHNHSENGFCQHSEIQKKDRHSGFLFVKNFVQHCFHTCLHKTLSVCPFLHSYVTFCDRSIFPKSFEMLGKKLNVHI